MTPPEALFREELRETVKDAVSPLLTEMKELRSAVNSLQQSSANRTEVYDRTVMDEKLAALKAEVRGAHEAVRAMKEFNWKLIGGVVPLVVVLVNILPHLRWLP